MSSLHSIASWKCLMLCWGLTTHTDQFFVDTAVNVSHMELIATTSPDVSTAMYTARSCSLVTYLMYSCAIGSPMVQSTCFSTCSHFVIPTLLVSYRKVIVSRFLGYLKFYLSWSLSLTLPTNHFPIPLPFCSPILPGKPTNGECEEPEEAQPGDPV